jgi:antirestriction protein ArdC
MHVASLYAQVTASIIAQLEAGAVPWTRPWKTFKPGSGVLPINAITGRAYSGVNIPILWGAASKHGFATHQWMTFRQSLAAGGHVRKGERGTVVVFTKQISISDEEDDPETISILRTYAVFNIAQIDDITDRLFVQDIGPEPLAVAEAFVKKTGASIRTGGNQAIYIPSADIIRTPSLSSFNDAGSYYATLLHELGHWTAHPTRLDRDLSNRFGTRAYAAEELIAELTSAFLCAELGIRGELRHAGYIQDWISLLSDDNRAIFTASTRASAAANYLKVGAGFRGD